VVALLVLASAALHAAWNLLARRHGRAREATTLFLAGSVVLSVPAALALSGPGWARAAPWGFAAGFGEAAYFVTLARALEIGPLGPVYTISRGGSMLLVWPASHWLLGESVGWRAAGAVLALLVGLALLAPEGEGRGTTSRQGYLWALACGLCIAAFQLVYKRAVGGGAAPLQMFVISMSTALPLVLWATPEVRRTLWRSARANPGLLAAGSVAMTASFVIALYVLRDHGAGWVMTLRNSSIGFAAVFGWTFLGERPSRRAGAGVALVLADALLLGSA